MDSAEAFPDPALVSVATTSAAGAGRLYVCACGQAIFFRNSLCIACGRPLGYDADHGALLPLQPSTRAGYWRCDIAGCDGAAEYRRCGNLETPAGCNWLIPVCPAGPEPPDLCVACRLNRTIPDLSEPGNGEKWRRTEVAKRRLVSSLLRLRLPVQSRLTEDPERGLAFDLLTTPPGGPAVMTGHLGGIITVNVDEAQDATREQIRAQMNESYRTILGHLRHESGHYYWERILGQHPLDGFRTLFGDERLPYDAALERHHREGPPAGWQDQFVSAYATSHPWEDWAETWAHYLHMTDTLDTALSLNLRLGQSALTVATFGDEILAGRESDSETPFVPLINGWIQLTSALNELSLSMGLADFYPFVLSAHAVRKLHFVHISIQRWRASSRPV